MSKKKIGLVFVTKQAVEYYDNTGFFKDIKQYFDACVLKLPSFEIGVSGITETNLPSLDFGSITDALKYVKEKASLRLNDKIFDNKNHHLYASYTHTRGLKQWLKFTIINLLACLFASKGGITFLEQKMHTLIRKSDFYKTLKQYFNAHKPDLLYITHQTTSYTLGVALAAKDLKIPVVCFIYSWDNIVKGNKLVKADYYYVWSAYMEQELLQYYPDEVREENIIVVGTPQFHHYSKQDGVIEKTVFFKAYKIPKKDFYICFSGNFTAIGQDDPAYLRDLALAVKAFNTAHKKQFHILLRANPADYNHGFTQIVNVFKNEITDVNPDWSKTNALMPVPKNKLALAVLHATLKYSDAVINVGSTMALDATLLGKLAYYIDYKIKGGSKKFNIEAIYKFIHFKSQKEMDNPIKHITDSTQYSCIFEEIQNKNTRRLEVQKKWAQKIVAHPIDEVSDRMLKGFQKIVNTCT
ncbi:MAG: glycosyltransferase family 4 protein [Flavobacteriaceae bacterium]|nr:glycosyltransferase family 4 protein [Flavobacteriaceae bacterium]